MKYVKAGLLDNIVSVYDQNKTTVYGRIQTKIVSGQTVLGPPLNKFVDTVADTTPGSQVVPVLTYLSPNGRLFSIGAATGGIAPLSLHLVNMTTGAVTYQGTIRIQLPNVATTTHTYRGFKVVDAGTTGWKIFLATSGSVLINGGLFMVNKADLVDFVGAGPGTLFSFATASDQKAVYFLQDPANIGAGQLNVAAAGATLDTAANRIYIHNGVAATHQFYVYNTLTTPTYTTNSVTGVAATDVINDAGHSFVNGTPLTFTSLTGGAGLTVATTYFVVSAVAGVSYQLSATSGGAAINFTTDITSATIGRAFGTTGSNFVHKTGNLPALTGTLIAADSEDYAMPNHTTNSGQACVFFCTSSNLYLGRLSELTSGAVAWPSLVSSNLLGTANQIVTPTLATATWSNVLDRAVFLTNNNVLIMKQVVNNNIDRIFAGANNIYRETFVSDVVPLQWLAASALDIEDGFLVVQTITNTGQRGVIISDIRSDDVIEYSYLITKVLDTPNSTYKFLTTIDKLYDFTGSLSVEYRTSGFGVQTGGWTSIPLFGEDLSGIASAAQIQFKIKWATLGLDTCIPAQIQDVFLGFESNTGISEHFEFSDDQSSNTSPSRIAFRLKKAYAISVPQLYFRAYDLSNVQLVNHNTVANAANFEYSTDNGFSWLPLGIIPNTVGTLVRYTFTSPPGVDIRPGIKES